MCFLFVFFFFLFCISYQGFSFWSFFAVPSSFDNVQICWTFLCIFCSSANASLFSLYCFCCELRFSSWILFCSSYLLLFSSFLLLCPSFLFFSVSFSGYFPFYRACICHLTFLLFALTCEVENLQSSFSQTYKYVLFVFLHGSSPLAPSNFLKKHSKSNLFKINLGLPSPVEEPWNNCERKEQRKSTHLWKKEVSTFRSVFLEWWNDVAQSKWLD